MEGKTAIRPRPCTSRQQGQAWMLTLYAKNEADNIPGAILKKIKEEFDGKD